MSAQPFQYPDQPPAGPPSPSAGRGLWISGIVVAAVGVLLAAVSAVLLFSGVVGAVGDQMSAPTLDSQGSTVNLDPGSYLVFQDSGTIPISASDLTVKGPDGTSVLVGVPDYDEQFTRGGLEFVAIAQFDAVQAGPYDVTVAVPDTGARLVVAPGFTSQIADRAAWGFGILGGGLLFVLGLVLFVVGLTRRRRARPQLAYPGAAYPGAAYQGVAYQQTGYPPAAYQQPAQQPAPKAAAGPPPGWYPDPDPSRPGGRRYWDGTAWTEHVA